MKVAVLSQLAIQAGEMMEKSMATPWVMYSMASFSVPMSPEW
jgi:hypothetical protein